MGDQLYDLLAPHFDSAVLSPTSSTTVTSYLSHLTTLPLSALSDTEPQSLAQSSNSNLLSLQALSTRYHKSVVTACDAIATLREDLPALTSCAASLRDGVPELDERALSFATKYSKSNTQSEILDRRKEAMLLYRNADRIADILELPSLLASIIASPSTAASSSNSSQSGPSGANYSQALDLFVHIKRLQILHPESALIESVLAEAEDAMRDMTSNLISSLRGQSIRLGSAIRSVGWLRRVAPELATPGLPQSFSKSLPGVPNASALGATPTTSEGSFGYLFLTCRLCNLLHMLEALTPLRDLADQETQKRLEKQKDSALQPAAGDAGSQRGVVNKLSHAPLTGHQTERYLKRYIEIYREQSFATVSMFKNIFPRTSLDQNAELSAATTINAPEAQSSLSFLRPPSTLSTFSSHLVSLLTQTLQSYLPNVSDTSARDSLMMQVLYAAGSLGRLGADFTLVIIPSLFPDDDQGDDSNSDDEEHQPAMSKSSSKIPASSSLGASNTSHDSSDMGQELQTAVHPQKAKKADNDQIPEYIRLLQKHRLQASKLEALSSSSSSPMTVATARPTAKVE